MGSELKYLVYVFALGTTYHDKIQCCPNVAILLQLATILMSVMVLQSISLCVMCVYLVCFLCTATLACARGPAHFCAFFVHCFQLFNSFLGGFHILWYVFCPFCVNSPTFCITRDGHDAHHNP